METILEIQRSIAEEQKDKKIAFISSSTSILLLLILTYFTTFFVVPPLPKDTPPLKSDEVIEEMLIDNVEMQKEEGPAGGSGSGVASNHQIAPPTPQTEKIVTSKSSDVKVNSGNSQNHNTNNNTTNTSSSTKHSENPFGTGGSGTTGQGAGNSPFGSGVGNGGDGPGGPGSGAGGRIRLNDPSTNNIIPNQDATINLKVTINADGDVISVSNIASKTTTTDQTIINKVIAAVKRDVRYSKAPGTPNAVQYITVKLYAQ